MSKYTLQDYNELAYDFAIRNPRVIELLQGALTKETAEELLTFGLYTEDSFCTSDGEEMTKYTLENLYLNYEHLPDSIRKEEGGQKTIFHPDAEKIFFSPEPIEDEIANIKELIPGKGGRLNYIMCRKIFDHYDQYIECNENINMISGYRNNKKQIKKDIEFVQEWIQPEQYLSLIPGYVNFVKRSLNNYKKSLLLIGNK
jgi:hypothetical protein